MNKNPIQKKMEIDWKRANKNMHECIRNEADSIWYYSLHENNAIRIEHLA